MAAISFSVRFQHFLVDDDGGTAIEYGLIMSLITLAIIAGLILLGASTSGMWGKLESQAGGALR